MCLVFLKKHVLHAPVSAGDRTLEAFSLHCDATAVHGAQATAKTAVPGQFRPGAVCVESGKHKLLASSQYQPT